jgi:DNA-binding HxlR family transcriptional regulator
MEQRGGYGQFCPVSKAAEVVAERWTPLILRELLMGSHRFNDLLRGVPLISRSLLSKRLKELEYAGLVVRRTPPEVAEPGYYLTEAGEALRPIIIALGEWGHRYVRSNFEHQDLDSSLLMWDIRRCARAERLPAKRTVIAFEFTDQTGADRSWWLLKEPAATELDLCLERPVSEYDVDLFVRTDLATMTKVWMGELDIPVALRSRALQLDGDTVLRLSFQDWIGLSMFAGIPARLA